MAGCHKTMITAKAVFLRCGTSGGLFGNLVGGSLLDQVHAALFMSHLLCLPWSICSLLSGDPGQLAVHNAKGNAFYQVGGH